MNLHIDIKSVLVGGLLVLVVLCVLGAVPWLSSDTHGRFQLDTNDGHAFILDSATGQVWSVWTPEGYSIRPAEADPNTFYAPKIDLVVG